MREHAGITQKTGSHTIDESSDRFFLPSCEGDANYTSDDSEIPAFRKVKMGLSIDAKLSSMLR
jgi:hypothetical protein